MSQFNLPETPFASKFGLPLPHRLEEFDKLRKDIRIPTFPIRFLGQDMHLPILRIPINLPKYRMANGRTVSSQEEYLAKHPSKQNDFFMGDPESLEAQEAQHGLLLALAKQGDKDKNLVEHFKNPANKQEPDKVLLLDEHGFVVNGNRRLATWRHLYSEDAKKYEHFAHVSAVVLPHCSEIDLDRLEASLQIKPDLKADYTWDAEANMMLQKRRRDGFSDKDLADLYDMKESQVREYIDMRNYAADYLISRGKENHWSLVSKHQYAFRNLVVGRSKIAKAGEQELFKQAAFTLIDRSDEAGGRLYEAIPGIQEYLDQIKSKLQEKFQVQAAAHDKSLEDLFGGWGGGGDIDIPLASVIQKPENSDAAREIIVEVIESQKQLEKEAKDANHLLKRCAVAQAKLREGLSEGFKTFDQTEANRKTVLTQLDQISVVVSEIRAKLESHA